MSNFLQANSEVRTNRRYGYLFPNLMVRREFGDEKSVSFLYSRRISRPTYNNIASYAAFWSSTAFTAANTYLLPAVSDAVSIDFHHTSWTFSVQYSYTENEITPLQPTIIQESNTLIYRSENLDHLNSLSFSTSYNFNFYQVFGV
jgi:hypothetical protein